MEVPDIKPRAMPEFKSKQSKYIHAGKLPMRAVVLGPSGSGKTVLLQNMILDIYRGCFEKMLRTNLYIQSQYKCGYDLGPSKALHRNGDEG